MVQFCWTYRSGLFFHRQQRLKPACFDAHVDNSVATGLLQVDELIAIVKRNNWQRSLVFRILEREYWLLLWKRCQLKMQLSSHPTKFEQSFLPKIETLAELIVYSFRFIIRTASTQGKLIVSDRVWKLFHVNIFLRSNYIFIAKVTCKLQLSLQLLAGSGWTVFIAAVTPSSCCAMTTEYLESHCYSRHDFIKSCEVGSNKHWGHNAYFCLFRTGMYNFHNDPSIMCSFCS